MNSGSSPLTRGGPFDDARITSAFGLIPAYAGRTDRVVFPRRVIEAHPRLRGADLKAVALVPFPAGSSPLTRGGPQPLRRVCGQRGLIPAYAGRTTPQRRATARIPAHPRLRGADLTSRRTILVSWGSSPLTRGGQAVVSGALPALGLIPAYAGRTGKIVETKLGHRAHPRLRGADFCRQLWRGR